MSLVEAVEAAGIPYEAMAAAAQAINDDAYALIGWEGITHILEAAAPYMLTALRADVAEANREHLEQFRDWKPGDPVE